VAQLQQELEDGGLVVSRRRRPQKRCELLRAKKKRAEIHSTTIAKLKEKKITMFWGRYRVEEILPSIFLVDADEVISMDWKTDQMNKLLEKSNIAGEDQLNFFTSVRTKLEKFSEGSFWQTEYNNRTGERQLENFSIESSVNIIDKSMCACFAQKYGEKHGWSNGGKHIES